jgi:hypothetical protein
MLVSGMQANAKDVRLLLQIPSGGDGKPRGQGYLDIMAKEMYQTEHGELVQ